MTKKPKTANAAGCAQKTGESFCAPRGDGFAGWHGHTLGDDGTGKFCARCCVPVALVTI